MNPDTKTGLQFVGAVIVFVLVIWLVYMVWPKKSEAHDFTKAAKIATMKTNQKLQPERIIFKIRQDTRKALPGGR